MEEDYHRVKFYPPSDLAFGTCVAKATKVLENFNAKSSKNINDILELYNIKKYFEIGAKVDNWAKEIPGIIGKFFATINSDNFIEIYSQVSRFPYDDDFVEAITYYKVYERISKEVFTAFLDFDEYIIHHVVEHYDLVKYYGVEIKNKLLAIDFGAEILLNKFVRGKENIYLPKELTIADKERIINNCLDSENPNLIDLRLIENVQNDKDFSLTPKTRLKAKQLCDQEEKKIFWDNNAGIKFETIISFKEQNEPRKIETSGTSFAATYGLQWLRENLDFPTLLNNFIYLFDYVDYPQFRFTYVSKPQDIVVFEKVITGQVKKYYEVSFVFNLKQQRALLQMKGYYEQLNKFEVRVEEVIGWFFKVYLQEKFSIDGFQFDVPTKESKYIEKCRCIAPEIEKVLKQYKLLIENGTIDAELLRLTQTQKYNEIPSKLEKKYAYIKHDRTIDCILYFVFSDQAMLSYFEKSKKREYKNFYLAMLARKIKIDEYKDFRKPEVQFLIDNRILTVLETGELKFSDIQHINILADLYCDQTISYWHYSKASRKKIDELYDMGYIEFENTLLSKPERDYLNYYLNKSEFVNGMDLKNSFSHGTETEMHETNYMTLLMLFVMIIIKINDDLWLYHDNFNDSE